MTVKSWSWSRRGEGITRFDRPLDVATQKENMNIDFRRDGAIDRKPASGALLLPAKIYFF